MPSFASEVKSELSRLMYEKQAERRAELSGLFRVGASVTIGMRRQFGVNFTTESAAVARKVLHLLKDDGAGVPTEIIVRRARRLRKRNNYTVRVAPSPKTEPLLEELTLLREGHLNLSAEEMGLSKIPLLRKKSCRAAFLRGAFLAGGSVNRPGAEYHLELVAGNYALGRLLYELMRRMGFPAGFTERKEEYIVYVKEGDAVAYFLELTGAEEAVELFEAARNMKEVRAQVNRIVNCETANLEKTVAAAARQRADVEHLVDKGVLKELPLVLREAAEARMEMPEASLAELAEKFCVSKSAMNHRFRKIRQWAEKF